jgi:putative spermidine/putrescine transport system ATP-binding protein
MIVNPAVLLLDEPFANLDRNLKMETARFIRTTQQEFAIPTVSVTHDLEEAFAMSDRIGVLLDGRLRQFDTPKQVYFNSATPEVAGFLGPVNTIPRDQLPLFRIEPVTPGPVMVRPESLTMSFQEQGPGLVLEKSFAGHYFSYTVAIGNITCTVYSQDDRFRPGRQVALSLKPL